MSFFLRREGNHQDKFLLLFSGKTHDGVVGFHVLFGRLQVARDFPEIFSIIKGLGILHVVGGIDVGLDIEQKMGIAQMGF